MHQHRFLVRVDGECWPHHPNPAVPGTGTDGFDVTYLRGIPVPAGGQLAAGQYACEYAKACTGQKCRLPRRMTSLARQGVDVQFTDPTTLAGQGLTGLPEVDQWILEVNPDRLPRDSLVWSPDLHHGRTVTS